MSQARSNPPRGKSAAKPTLESKLTPMGDGTSAPLPKAARERADRDVGPTHPDSMTPELVEFLAAIDNYKRSNQRPFPSLSEVFEVLRALGYRKGR